jgi:hypothetical protein
MDNAPRTQEERVDRIGELGHEEIDHVHPQKVILRKRFVDPAEEVMSSNHNLSPPITPNPN